MESIILLKPLKIKSLHQFQSSPAQFPPLPPKSTIPTQKLHLPSLKPHKTLVKCTKDPNFTPTTPQNNKKSTKNSNSDSKDSNFSILKLWGLAKSALLEFLNLAIAELVATYICRCLGLCRFGGGSSFCSRSLTWRQSLFPVTGGWGVVVFAVLSVLAAVRVVLYLAQVAELLIATRNSDNKTFLGGSLDFTKSPEKDLINIADGDHPSIPQVVCYCLIVGGEQQLT